MNTYHITFGTYGTRLHGGKAPTVHHSRNRIDDPLIESDPELWKENRQRMKESACIFSMEQREFVETEIPGLCERGSWTYHLSAAQDDHIHLLLSAEADSKAVRKWVKTWLSQMLNEKYGERTWFAKGGSGKWVNDDDYYAAVYRYILKQRTTK